MFQPHEAADGGPSSLAYEPVLITDAAAGSPIVVAAARVRAPPGRTIPPRFASGWGETVEQAAQGCVFEGDETYFAQVGAADRLLRAPAASLPGLVSEPPSLLLFSEAQYARRSAWNKRHHERNAVPVRWRRARPLDWLRSDARFGEEAWIPAGLCRLDHPVDPLAGLPPGDSNGLAVGPTLEQAAVRGFLETVERDATAIWWYNRLVVPRLDLASFSDDLISRYGEFVAAQRRVLILLWLTVDLPIPVVGAISHDRMGRRVAFGFASGHSPVGAARRALGELAQCEANVALMDRLVLSSGASRLTPSARAFHRWHHTTKVHRHQFLQGGQAIAAPAGDVAPDWRFCRDLCGACGLKPLVVDLSGPGSPPLVRVVVPGLRSIRPRLGPGRLDQVPISVGLATPSGRAFNRTPFPT